MENKLKSATWIINSLPKKYRSKAFSLLRYISRNYNMKWDEKGVFKYKNKLIPNSNILHLVLHALIKINRKPPGMREFYEGLKDVNVPTHLVKNEIGLKILTGMNNNNNNWGPPKDIKKRKK